MADRPRAFDSNYAMMRSLIDGVTATQIREEIPRLEKTIRTYDSEIGERERYRSQLHAKLRVLKEILENHEMKKLREEFKLTEEHKKIIKEINWEVEKPYEYMETRDVCRLLEFKKPNDDYSDEQYDHALKLLKEIPIAVNRFFRGDEA